MFNIQSIFIVGGGVKPLLYLVNKLRFSAMEAQHDTF